ncbi:MAG: D-alanyl-D-alanine carboxypeptidase family protein [Candidatus Nomurabacteria bacterium]|nr:D-alanyl-D-alanine carboxypeptidase family protein [Candidatus Nomurabacteria bacterium]USN88194.1 MAG: D-alanyl-D-alanine carboxypeptidase family protein [Candidatus Nomurabacteria bacterium]
MSQEPKTKSIKIVVLILIVILVALTGYLFLENSKKTDQILALNTERDELQISLEKLGFEKTQIENTAEELTKELTLTKETLQETEDDLRHEKNKNDDFEDQIRSISGTVKDLDKLSKTDEELLQKYSRTYFLNENFIPLKLKQIDDKYILPGKKDQYFHGDAIGFLEDLLDAAKRAGHDIKIVSAYRSFDEQQDLKGQYTQVYGSGSNAFSADQGYSEHQLGTTVDLTDESTNGTYQSFGETEAYKWLVDNAYRYGFILSYPENNEFYIYEPWHWRFVGTDLAGDLHRKNAQFYEWDQRKIDEYLIKIFD